MPPKKEPAAPEPQEEVEEEDQQEEVDQALVQKCFRVGCQLYYGYIKKAKKGTYVRHGDGRQVNSAVTPASYRSGGNGAQMLETVILGTYEGNWEEDAMTGQGTYKWADGGSYEGAFVDGQLHGHGRYVWPDGSAYEGAWHMGTMNGQGRLDSRFDGSFLQGRFHRNCFQKQDKTWVNVLEKQRESEQRRIWDGDTSSTQVRRVDLGDETALEAAFLNIQNDGLVPFVVAEDSVQASSLECLRRRGLASSSSQCCSVRIAAIAKRRQRDYHHFFYDAIRHSLTSGSLFIIALEDDDDGSALTQDARDNWFTRDPVLGPPVSKVPEDWRLEIFFHKFAFPMDVFSPILFNGRGKYDLFLPPDLQKKYLDTVANNTGVLPNPATIANTDAPPAEGAEGVDDAVADAAAAAKALKELAAAAASPMPARSVGPTGHCFQSPTEPQETGLPVVYCLRPAVVALAQLPAGLSDSEVRTCVVDRYQQHLPLHRTVIVVLGTGSGISDSAQ